MTRASDAVPPPSTAAVAAATATATAAIEPGVYEHFKGARYEVLLIARHSETEEEFVVYRQLGGDGAHWVRPLTMFTETVERDGRRTARFSRVDATE
jgi:hypothetical protein